MRFLMIKVICIKHLMFVDEENFMLPQATITFSINSNYLLDIRNKREETHCNFYMHSIDGVYMINLAEKEVKEYFITQTEWREKQIDDILN